MAQLIPIFSFVYTGASIYFFMAYFYFEEIRVVNSILISVLIFAPQILSGHKNVSTRMLIVTGLAGFLLGFIIYGTVCGINAWPLAMTFWLILSVPAIAGLHFIGNKIINTDRV